MPEDAHFTEDGFLGGRLRIVQPRDGYRAATDPVLLAAAVPAVAGQSVLELGCGTGVAALCLGARVPGLSLCGVERDPASAGLARRNAVLNAIEVRVIEADLAVLPPDIRALTFDHVIANPPYFIAGCGTDAVNAARAAALREETPLAVWIDVALRRLAPGGWLTMIQRAERLPEILTCLSGRAGSLAILPIASRSGRPAARIVLRARKADRGPARLLAPFILHEGSMHLAGGDNFTPDARAILRDGASLAQVF